MTLRGISKMGPAKLKSELHHYEKIEKHLESKYAHLPLPGEYKKHNLADVKSIIKDLKEHIAKKGKGGTRRRGRGTRSTRRRY